MSWIMLVSLCSPQKDVYRLISAAVVQLCSATDTRLSALRGVVQLPIPPTISTHNSWDIPTAQQTECCKCEYFIGIRMLHLCGVTEEPCEFHLTMVREQPIITISLMVVSFVLYICIWKHGVHSSSHFRQWYRSWARCIAWDSSRSWLNSSPQPAAREQWTYPVPWTHKRRVHKYTYITQIISYDTRD
jgi:hypothetical protein